MIKVNSYFSNVVYLDIETSGLDPNENEILEIGCIKFSNNKKDEFSTLIKPLKQIPSNIFDLCTNLTMDELINASSLKNALTSLKEFIGDLPLICHNGKFEKEFLRINFFKENLTFNNKILDTMELFALLEPYHKEYNLEYFIKRYIDHSRFEYHRALNDSKDTLLVLNKVLESNDIGKFLYYSKILNDWDWIDYLTYYNIHNEIFKVNNCEEVALKETETNFNEIYLPLMNNCEDILKNEEAWKKLNPKYKFRIGQFEVMKNVRKSLERDTISIIEAPTGTGKSIAYSLPAIKEALYGKKVFISTNTKELQSQLVNKDIPFLLNTFNLKGKLDYLIIKGKGNYLCSENIKDILNDELFKSNLTLSERLGLVYLDLYTYQGKYGDYEEINYWIIDNFKIDYLMPLCRCDSDGCDLKHCRQLCFYKDTVEKLKNTNLVILNHSLLLKWPYEDEIKHVIIDEGHNLSDSIYDAYADVLNSRDLTSLLLEILDYNKNKGYLNYLWKHLRNKQAAEKELIRDRIDECIKSIEILPYHTNIKINNDYNLDVTFNETYENYEIIKHDLLVLKENLNEFYKCLKRLIDKNNLDDTNIKSRGEILIKKCDKVKEFIDLIECFINENENSKCYGFSCDKGLRFWEIYIKHLNSSYIFFERFLNTTSSCSFLSATLKSKGNYDDFKKSLAIEKVENKYINEVIDIGMTFDLKSRSIIASPISSFKYDDPGFIDYMIYVTLNLLPKVDGNILILFTSKKRLDNFREKIIPSLNKFCVRLYDRKKDLNKLKDKSRKSILLGSKGFFEGIDIPGDALTCVIMDKLPNINPKVPLFNKLISRSSNFNMGYSKVNSPRVTTIFKQCFGRLIRTELDYGYFFILDGGNNSVLWSNLIKEYKDVPFLRQPFNKILDDIPCNYKRWNILNFEYIIDNTKDILEKILIENNHLIQDKEWLIKTMNKFYDNQFEEKLLTNKFILKIKNDKFIEAFYTIDNSKINLKNKYIFREILSNVYNSKI